MMDPVAPISQSSLEGMHRAEAQLNTAAAHIAKMPDSVQPGGDTVDLSAEIVALMSARDNFMANVGAAKTGDQIQRALLNIID